MSNTTYSSQAFVPASRPPRKSLLGELFAATPLYIFATALMASLKRADKR